MKRGFTLLEIMVALAIFSLAFLALHAGQGISLKESARAENVQIASILGRQKMNEKMIEFNKNLAKGTFPEDKEEDGSFDAPYDTYKWFFKVRQVKIPVIGEGDDAQAGQGNGGAPKPATTSDGSTSSTAVAVPESAKRSQAQMVSKKISELLREITLKVTWDEMGQEESFTITTHVAKVP